MKLLRMTANFGKLRHETLELREDMNVISLPNEAGKSTWMAFLEAMFYGIDTSERAKAEFLPMKVQYQPWSGEAMEGSMELEWKGKHLLITRRSTPKNPMGVFSCVDLASGSPVEGMTGDNCGMLLLGVERSVFLRSCFIRQSGLAVSADAKLETRLSALVSTGDETVDVRLAEKRLHEEKVRCKYNRSGRIPEQAEALEQVENKLDTLHRIHAETLQTRQALRKLEQREAELQTILEALQARESERKRQARFEAHRTYIVARNKEQAAKNVTDKLPGMEKLNALEEEGRDLLHAPEIRQPQSPGESPICPEAFRGVQPEKLLLAAQYDKQQYEKLTKRGRYPTAVFWVLFGVLLAVSGVLFWNVGVFGIPFALAAVCALVLAVTGMASNRKREREREQAEAISAKYGHRDPEEFVCSAAEYAKALTEYTYALEQYHAQKAEADAKEKERNEATRQFVERVAAFGRNATDLASACEAVGKAQYYHEEHRLAEEKAQQAKAAFDAICLAVEETGEAPEASVDTGSWTEGQARDALAETRQKLQSLQAELNRAEGFVQSCGDEAELEAKRQLHQKEIDRLTQRYDALELAEQALQQANEALQSRFAPELMKKAGDYLRKLTNGAYDTLLMDRQMHLQVGNRSTMELRPVTYLSRGTADQVYLALRLAIAATLLPQDAPIALDEALAMFDDERLRLALEVLLAESQKRQILLFSCHNREKQMLEMKE